MQDKLYLLPASRGDEPEQATKSNLPLQLTPLIDREHELATACSLLRCSQVRLLTLTGTGGVGKTRPAVQVATEFLDDFADGVYFVSLAPITDADLVLSTIAQTFGPLGMNLLHWYTRRVNELTAFNPLISGRFYQVLHLLKPPTVLFSPRVIWAVLAKELASHRQKPVASLPAVEVSSPSPTRSIDEVAS